MTIRYKGIAHLNGKLIHRHPLLSPGDWTTPTELGKYQASGAVGTEYYGYSVGMSADGNTAIVGAERAGELGYTYPGAVYILVRNGDIWTEQQKLTAGDPSTNNRLGTSVSISSDGNTAISGAIGSEACYVYTRTGSVWTEQQKLTASDGAPGSDFGLSVDISDDGNTLIVGAMNESTISINQGAAYVYTRSGGVWTEQQKLTRSTNHSYDFIGVSVAISGDSNTVIIGAYNDSSVVIDSGAAYVFTRTGSVWSEQQKLKASDAEGSSRFGDAVTISNNGDTAIVGAKLDDTSGSNSNTGAVYAYTRTGSAWTEQQKLVSGDIQASDNFGASVDISADGNTLAIGVPAEDTNGSNSGAAYVFTQDGGSWTEQEKLLASDGEASDFFGPVGISGIGNTIICGAHGEDTGGSFAGAAYIYKAG